MKLNEYEDKHATQRILITGLSGSGKTTLAATLSKQFNVIWIDVENAVDTLAKLPMEQKERVTLIKLPDSAAFPIAAQTVQHLFKTKKGNICQEHGVNNCPVCLKANAPFQLVDLSSLNPKTDVVVLDGLTQIGYSFLSHLTKNEPIDYKPKMDDWGGLRKNTEYLASNIQAAPFNLVVTALPDEVTMEDGRVKLVPSFGSKAMSAAIGAKFGTIIYCDVKNKKHLAFSDSTASNQFLSKSRTGFRIEELPEPDLCPLFSSSFAPVAATATANTSNIINSINKLAAPSAATNSLKNLSSASKVNN